MPVPWPRPVVPMMGCARAHGCAMAVAVPCLCHGWDQDGRWQPRGAWGRSGTRCPGATGWDGGAFQQAMGVGLSSLVPALVRGVRTWWWWWHHAGLLVFASPLPWRMT